MAAYKGESGRNGFSRGCEHLDGLNARDEEKSVLWLHSKFKHQERGDVVYTMQVTGGYKDPLDRQLIERVQISNFRGSSLMNRIEE